VNPYRHLLILSKPIHLTRLTPSSRPMRGSPSWLTLRLRLKN